MLKQTMSLQCFEGCLLQNLIGPFLHNLTYVSSESKLIVIPTIMESICFSFPGVFMNT